MEGIGEGKGGNCLLEVHERDHGVAFDGINEPKCLPAEEKEGVKAEGPNIHGMASFSL